LIAARPWETEARGSPLETRYRTDARELRRATERTRYRLTRERLTAAKERNDMSLKPYSATEFYARAVADFACPLCGAKPGEPCTQRHVTGSIKVGDVRKMPHPDRSELARKAGDRRGRQ
jgi:hypothetical protein